MIFPERITRTLELAHTAFAVIGVPGMLVAAVGLASRELSVVRAE